MFKSRLYFNFLCLLIVIYSQPVADVLSQSNQRAVTMTDGGINSNNTTGNVFSTDTSGSNPMLDILNPEGDVGSEGNESLKDLYVFGDKLSPRNKGLVSSIDKHNDPLIGIQPNIPPSMDVDKWLDSSGSSAVTRSSFGASNNSQVDVSESFARGAMGPMRNTYSLMNHDKINEGLLNPNTLGTTARAAMIYADPAVADSIQNTAENSLKVFENFNQTSGNMHAMWGDSLYGDSRKRAYQACLDQAGKSQTSVPVAECLEYITGNSSNNSGLSGGLFGGSGGSLLNVSNLLGGLGLNQVAGIVSGVASGDFSSALKSLGINTNVTDFQGFTQALNQNGFGQYANIANLANSGDTTNLLKTLNIDPTILNGNNSNTGGINGIFGTYRSSTNGSSVAAAQVKDFQNNRSALTRAAVMRASSGGSGARAYCGNIADGLPSQASCSPARSNGGTLIAAVRNSYYLFPGNDSDNNQRRRQYQDYFGDQCIACYVGGKDSLGKEISSDSEVLVTSKIEPDAGAETSPANNFKKINKEVYEALRGALYNKCLHDNALPASGAEAKGASVFRVTDNNGSIPDIYQDGDFWKGDKANSEKSALTANITAREALQYLSFPDFRLSAGILDGIYDIVSEKNAISTETHASWNDQCDKKFGATSGEFSWDNIVNSFKDEKLAAKLKREIKAVIAISQRITLGKVYDSCDQALGVVREVKAPAEMTEAATLGILEVCTGTSNMTELQTRKAENVANLSQMIDRMYAELAADSGKSGSAVAKAFKGERSEAKSQVGG